MAQRISLREANQRLSQYIAAVERGEEIIITRRGKPVAKLVKVTQKRRLSAEQKAAWARTLARLRRGFSLGGEKFDREAVHER